MALTGAASRTMAVWADAGGFRRSNAEEQRGHNTLATTRKARDCRVGPHKRPGEAAKPPSQGAKPRAANGRFERSAQLLNWGGWGTGHEAGPPGRSPVFWFVVVFPRHGCRGLKGASTDASGRWGHAEYARRGGRRASRGHSRGDARGEVQTRPHSAAATASMIIKTPADMPTAFNHRIRLFLACGDASDRGGGRERSDRERSEQFRRRGSVGSPFFERARAGSRSSGDRRVFAAVPERAVNRRARPIPVAAACVLVRRSSPSPSGRGREACGWIAVGVCAA